MTLNESVFNFFYGFSNKSIIIDMLVVFLGQYLLYILIIVALGAIFFEKNFFRRYYFSFLSILSILFSSGIIVSTIRYLYYNPRPFVQFSEIDPLIAHTITSSMPSGHMMFVVPLSLVIFYFNRRMGYWFFAGVFLMGISRIMAGVHWPYDILAGIVLGTVAFYLARLILGLAGFKLKEVELSEPSN